MKPVDQTEFYNLKSNNTDGIGNCLSAVVASLLELDITEVPNFVKLHLQNSDDMRYHWWVLLQKFIKEQGYQYKQVKKDEWLKNELYLVSGLSPRSNKSKELYHICIYQNGKLYFDPHFTREGLLSEEAFYTLRKL